MPTMSAFRRSSGMVSRESEMIAYIQLDLALGKKRANPDLSALDRSPRERDVGALVGAIFNAPGVRVRGARRRVPWEKFKRATFMRRQSGAACAPGWKWRVRELAQF